MIRDTDIRFYLWGPSKRYFGIRVKPVCWEFRHTVYLSLWYLAIEASWKCKCFIKEGGR